MHQGNSDPKSGDALYLETCRLLHVKRTGQKIGRAGTCVMVDWWSGSSTLTAAAVQKAKKKQNSLDGPIGHDDRNCGKVPQKFLDFRHPS